MKKIAIFLGIILAVPLVLANLVADTFTNFVEGTSQLLKGNTSAFMYGLVGLLPLIALVLIVFGLMLFLSRITIFKHPDHEKYAKMIAAGIAIIGLIQQNVYNTILGWSTTFLIFAFIVAIIFMAIMFINHNRKQHLPLLTDVRKAQTLSLSAKKDLEKIKHDLSMDKRFYKRVGNDLVSLESALNETESLIGSELSQVQEIIDLLSKLASAQKAGDSGLINQYAQALGNKIGALLTSMKQQDKDDSKLFNLVVHVEKILNVWIKNNHDDFYNEKHAEDMINKIVKTTRHAGLSDADINKLLHTNTNVNNHIKSLKQMLRDLHRENLYLIKALENFESVNYKKKVLEASSARSAIFNGEFETAHKHMHTLQLMLNHQPKYISEMQGFASRIKTMLRRIAQQEVATKTLVEKELDALHP